MAQCSLCMSEVHPQATVCASCGAVKVAQANVGYLKGAAILGLILLWLVLTLGGYYLLGFACIGGMAAIMFTAKQRHYWIKKA